MKLFLSCLTKSILASSTAVTITAMVGSASAAVVIHEPFGTTGAISGQAGGTGLSGNWSGSGTVTTGSLSYGTLPTSGGKLSFSGVSLANVSLGTTLSSAGLMNDGATLWFSALVVRDTLVFAIGSNAVASQNTISNGGDRDAIGFRIQNGSDLNTIDFNNGAFTRTGAGSLAAGTHLVVGSITWGATSDTITLYTPDANLNIGSAVGSQVANVNQSGFTLLSIRGNSSTAAFDEIRFGASYDDVIGVVPEPATALLVGLGIMLLLRRRRTSYHG